MLVVYLCVLNHSNRTLTAPVELIKCLRAIKAHAFDVSDYPVVVTLEDHLTPELQSKVAEVTSFYISLRFYFYDLIDHDIN